MKKLVYSALAIILFSILLLESRQFIDETEHGSNNTLTIFNWGEYIDPELLEEFTNQTGIKVIYETFDSNEALLTKMKSGHVSYDIVIPSDYMIEKMINFDLLQKIDKTKITSYSNLNEELLNKSFDVDNKYSIPYFWGTLGIVYNKELVDKDLKFEKWDDIWDGRLKNEVILVDGAREMLGIALQSEGYSVNETDEIKLRLAEKKLELMGSNIKAINNDEKTMIIVNSDAKVAVTFSGSAAKMIDENDKLVYSVPKEGSNIWFDNMAIPKNAKNVEAAHKFINFMLEPKNAAKNAKFIGYATPVKNAYDILGKEIVTDEQFYPNEETMHNLEVYDAQSQKIVQLQNDLFLEFKINIARGY